MEPALPDFLSITRAHVEEIRTTRMDIIAACVGGSVARGDPLPVSDIDVRLVTDVWIEPPVPFREVDAWRDGVHIDAQLVPRAYLSRMEGYLDHPYTRGCFDTAVLSWTRTDTSPTFRRG